ncbi:hypothetical protein AAHB37_03205 [Glutamicibacter halophytocola]|uniref:hypothetical protein n=1 Tax=Glutamicibacter halophytocola TaxID=1933880 RepID=UPI00321A5017
MLLSSGTIMVRQPEDVGKLPGTVEGTRGVAASCSICWGLSSRQIRGAAGAHPRTRHDVDDLAFFITDVGVGAIEAQQSRVEVPVPVGAVVVIEGIHVGLVKPVGHRGP